MQLSFYSVRREDGKTIGINLADIVVLHGYHIPGNSDHWFDATFIARYSPIRFFPEIADLYLQKSGLKNLLQYRDANDDLVIFDPEAVIGLEEITDGSDHYLNVFLNSSPATDLTLPFDSVAAKYLLSKWEDWH
jgi:hypothetical protein